MKPYVFISSTIGDLHHLRESIRDTLETLCYNPVMSEFAEVDFRADSSAIESCYRTIGECQLFILIIGKKYGHICENGLSVTHNELRHAKQLQIPIICLLDSEIDSYRKLYNLNKGAQTKYPEMDNPDGTFNLISELDAFKTNNAFILFKTNQEANVALKKQLAGMFFRFLNEKNAEFDSSIKDILSEIQSLKHTLFKGDILEAKMFTKGIRLLLDKQFEDLKDLSEKYSDGIEDMVAILIGSTNFNDAAKKLGISVRITDMFDRKDFIESLDPFKDLNINAIRRSADPFSIFEPYKIDLELIKAKKRSVKVGFNNADKIIYLNKEGEDFFNLLFAIYKSIVEQKLDFISFDNLYRIQMAKYHQL